MTRRLASTLLLLGSLLMLAGSVAPARAQVQQGVQGPKDSWDVKFPHWLFEKPVKGKKPKLRGPKCPECQKEWEALRDALASWYFLQFRDAEKKLQPEINPPAGVEPDQNKIKQLEAQKTSATSGLDGLGIPASGKDHDAAVNASEKRKKDNPDYGDRDKLRKMIDDLMYALRSCYVVRCRPKPNIPIPELPKECFETWQRLADTLKELKDLRDKWWKIAVDLAYKKGTTPEEIGDPANPAADDSELVQAKANSWAARDQYDKALGIPVCPEDKTNPPNKEGGGGGEAPKKASTTPGGPKKKHPKRSVTGLYSERQVSERRFTETTVVTGMDSNVWCTYDDGVGMDTTIIATDENGTPIEVTTSDETTATSEGEASETEGAPTTSGGTPSTPETPNVAEIPPEQTSQPPESTPKQRAHEKQPEPPPTTPETPKVTEELPKPPPEQPPSTPIPDTIFFKANEEVLKGQPKGPPIQEEVVKLLPTDEPDLPGTGAKEVEDTDFDEDPVQGTTDANGEAKIQVPTKDRARYGLPGKDEKSAKYYRLDYDLPQQNDGVVETTGKSNTPDLKTGTPAGADVTAEAFKIGDRTFARLRYKQPYGLNHDFREQYTPTYGAKYEEDYCRDQQPGLPLGMQPTSLSALNHELPQAPISLGGAPRGTTP